MLRNLVDNDNFLPYYNCFRGCSTVILFILVATFPDNETVKYLCIFAIIIIVFSFSCCGTPIQRIRRISELHRMGRRRRNRHVHRNRNRRMHHNRNRHVHHNEIMFGIIQQVNANSIHEYLLLVRNQTVCYRLGPKDPHIGEECCICLDEFKYKSKVCRLECCHLFHKKCIEKWLLEKPICPLCKYDIFEELDIIIEVDDEDDDEDEDISIDV